MIEEESDMAQDLRKLPDAWRGEKKALMDHQMNHGRIDALEDCASELERVLDLYVE